MSSAMHISNNVAVADRKRTRAALEGIESATVFLKARTETHPVYTKDRVSRVIPFNASWTYMDKQYDKLVRDYTADVVRKNSEDLETGGKWADVDVVPIDVLKKRQTYSKGQRTMVTLKDADIIFDDEERPLFPYGRTGIRGRGLLGRWGPNFAADPIITRFHPSTGCLQVLLVVRRDTSELALPGGMVDPGHSLSETFKKEVTEEALKPDGAVDILMSNCDMGVIYMGAVDDPRTTDNAWIETVAKHFHASPDIATKLVLETADVAEIKDVNWYNAEDVVGNMYASHGSWLRKVMRNMM